MHASTSHQAISTKQGAIILRMSCQKLENVPMPSRMDKFGLITSLALTRSISPIYKWFVGTKTLHNSSSPSSVCNPENSQC